MVWSSKREGNDTLNLKAIPNIFYLVLSIRTYPRGETGVWNLVFPLHGPISGIVHLVPKLVMSFSLLNLCIASCMYLKHSMCSALFTWLLQDHSFHYKWLIHQWDFRTLFADCLHTNCRSLQWIYYSKV